MSSGTPPNYPWLQQLGTVLDEFSEPGINGFEPQLWFTGGLPKLPVIESNRQTSMARFKTITGSTMPGWWPFHANGMMVTHLYRLIDEYLANDLKFPKSSPAMSHNLQPEEPVDFTTKQNKQLSLQHVSRVSEGYYALRPFLSASLSLEDIVGFGDRKMVQAEKKGQKQRPEYVRFDLITMWSNGRLTETSFVQLDNQKKFDKYFRKDGVDFDFLEWNDINYQSCQNYSSDLNEWLLGVRGNWWTRFCTRVSRVGGVLDDQSGGYGSEVLSAEAIRCIGFVGFNTEIQRYYELLRKAAMSHKVRPRQKDNRTGAFPGFVQGTALHRICSSVIEVPPPPPPTAKRLPVDIPPVPQPSAARLREATAVFLPVPTEDVLPMPKEAPRSLTPDSSQPQGQPSTLPIPRTLPCVPLTALIQPALAPEAPPAKRHCTKETPEHISAASGSSTPSLTPAMSHIARQPAPPPQQPQRTVQSQTPPTPPPADPVPVSKPPQTATPPPMAAAPARTPPQDLSLEQKQNQNIDEYLPEDVDYSPMPEDLPEEEEEGTDVIRSEEEGTDSQPQSTVPQSSTDDKMAVLVEMQRLWVIMVVENAEKVMNAAGWSSEAQDLAMSHKATPATVLATIVHGLSMDHNTRCSVLPRLGTIESEGLAGVQRIEWQNRSIVRQYNDKLQVSNYYTTNKRKEQTKRLEERQLQLDRGYTWKEVGVDYEMPLPEQTGKELKASSDSQTIFTRQLVDLALIEEDAFSEDFEADKNFELLMRFFTLDNSIMGVRAANLVRSLCSYWRKKGEYERCVPNSYEPEKKTVWIWPSFAYMMDQNGFVKIPHKNRFLETHPTYTINCPNNYPPKELRTVTWFANMHGFESVDDEDDEGKNFFHHVCQAAKFSGIASEVLVHAFLPSADRLPGNYTSAMRHKIHSGPIAGYSPGHVLLNGSDIEMVQDRIIHELLVHKVLVMSDFDDNPNIKVCFFYIARALPLSVEAASPTYLPSYNGGCTGTYV